MTTEGQRCSVTTKATSWAVEEIVTRYCGSFETENFYSKMSSQGLHERLTSLKAHAFFNSDGSSNEQSTNYDDDRRIDKPNKTPPQGTISVADFEPINTVGEREFTFEAHATQGVDRSDGKVGVAVLPSCSSSDLTSEGANDYKEQTIRGLEQAAAISDVVSISTPTRTISPVTNDKNIEILQPGLQIVTDTPTVVITPADSMEDDPEKNSEQSNGGLPGSTLRDMSDTCSGSSGCSADEILTDDDHSEDEPAADCKVKSPFKQKTRWKKIRNMIHWSPFVQNFKKKYPWVQLAGHQGCFKPGENGAILKKSSDKERECLTKLMKDILRPYIPEYKREVEKSGEKYLEMQDLLQEFDSPSVMDCKMGVRTYLEEELAKAKSKPRKDLYQKMFDVDPNEPTEAEKKEGSITKPRYMQWRERLSSSASLGFRIEGVAKGVEKPNKDFKKTKTKGDVQKVFTDFVENDENIRAKYIRRLKAIRATLECSAFFRTHEVIGSSLLFVHDSKGRANVWMIDFGKTVPVHDGISLDHRKAWVEGNHEDGYLWGLDNMLETWSQR